MIPLLLLVGIESGLTVVLSALLSQWLGWPWAVAVAAPFVTGLLAYAAAKGAEE